MDEKIENEHVVLINQYYEEDRFRNDLPRLQKKYGPEYGPLFWADILVGDETVWIVMAHKSK